MKVKVKIKGVQEVKTGFKKLEKRLLESLERAVMDCANHLWKESIKQVPHDKGRLQNSFTMSTIQTGSDRIAISVGYNTVYAIRLHEHPEYKFQKNRKGKYLEDPLKQNTSKYKNYIINSFKRIIG